MTVLEIVKEYLETHNYDGLVDGFDGECGCLKEDLAPCGEMGQGCIAGHKIEGETIFDSDWAIKEGKADG